MPKISAKAPPDPVAEAARLARRMRGQGKSNDRIAAELEVSVATVRAWLKYRSPSAQPRPQRPKTVTPRRRLFAKALTEGQNQVKAAMTAGCPNTSAARDFAYQATRSPEFIDYFNRILDEAGLDEQSLAAGLKECLQADKVVGVAVNKNTGTITDTKTHPDYQVRHQALRTAFELRKRLNQRNEEAAAGAAPVHLHLTLQQKERYERLVGGPLDTDAITVVPEAPPKEHDHGAIRPYLQGADPAAADRAAGAPAG